jgi:hypothetical protein
VVQILNIKAVVAEAQVVLAKLVQDLVHMDTVAMAVQV